MYLGWKVRGRMAREYLGETESCSLYAGNKAAIWSAIDFEIGMFEGEKLNDVLDEVGVDSEQLTAQHRRDASAAAVFSLLRAFSQHFIILSFDECSGVPDTTPPMRAKSKKISANLVSISLNI